MRERAPGGGVVEHAPEGELERALVLVGGEVERALRDGVREHALEDGVGNVTLGEAWVYIRSLGLDWWTSFSPESGGGATLPLLLLETLPLGRFFRTISSASACFSSSYYGAVWLTIKLKHGATT